jgi:hypothetical protein
MITQEQAEELVYTRVNLPNPHWPDMPEMIVTCVEPHELGWLVFYSSRLWVETRDFKHALAGNGPLLVSCEDGTMVDVSTAPPLAERVQEAASELAKQFQDRGDAA